MNSGPWGNMTAKQRSNEMKRRQAVAKMKRENHVVNHVPTTFTKQELHALLSLIIDRVLDKDKVQEWNDIVTDTTVTLGVLLHKTTNMIVGK